MSAGNRKIKPTLTKGVAKVPVVMQLEALECGAASLAMVMAYYGKWVPLEQVRVDCGVSRDGSKAKNIYIAAQHYGFDMKAYSMVPEKLRESGQFPCIIHWNMNHFVVLNGFRGKNVYINDQDCREEKLKTLRHELRHYELHHIGSGKTVRAMENEAG